MSRGNGGIESTAPRKSSSAGYILAPIVMATAAVAVLGVFSTFYTVEPHEKAVVLVFGRYYETEGPGPHLKLPFGIQEVYKVPTEKIHKLEFGFRTTGVDDQGRSTYDPSQQQAKPISMLTGDLNIADVEWIIQYKISDAKAYMFNVREVEGTLRDVSEAVMSGIIGNRTVDEVLTIGRSEIESEAASRCQEIFDSYGMGVKVVTIQLQSVNPPEAVRPSFNDVNKAMQDKEKTENEAIREYNREIPRAQGEAGRVIESAQGYAIERVSRARGEAAQFGAVFAEYRKAPEVTLRRLYLETLQYVIKKVPRVDIIDHKGVAPYFMNFSGSPPDNPDGPHPAPNGKTGAAAPAKSDGNGAPPPAAP